MSNTLMAQIVKLSQTIYEEWLNKTVLVGTCDRTYEGELNLETMELDIPVYHDLSVHATTLKERDLKPANPEFIKSSTVRVTIDKGRYSHWATKNLDKLIDRYAKDDSVARKKLIEKWAIKAEKELAVYCASLPANQTLDMTSMISGGLVTYSNLFAFLNMLKAHAKKNDYEETEFKLFASEKISQLAADAKMTLGSNLDANDVFKNGYKGHLNDVDIREISVSDLVTRNETTGLVDAEVAIWKTDDGIQYVVPYKGSAEYEITADKILGGGKGYQLIEYYDYFNIYPKRLMKVKIRYTANATIPAPTLASAKVFN